MGELATIKSITESKSLKIQRQIVYAHKGLEIAGRGRIASLRAINKSAALVIK